MAVDDCTLSWTLKDLEYDAELTVYSRYFDSEICLELDIEGFLELAGIGFIVVKEVDCSIPL